jgi:hypothetical protein
METRKWGSDLTQDIVPYRLALGVLLMRKWRLVLHAVVMRKWRLLLHALGMRKWKLVLHAVVMWRSKGRRGTGP